MMAPKINVNVEVVTKKKPVRYGTVKRAIGHCKWVVEFKNQDGTPYTEELSSQHLKVNKEYYNLPEKSPVRSALKTIRKIVETVGRRRRRAPQIQRDSSSSSVSSGHNDYDDEDFQPTTNNENASDESPSLSPVVLPESRQLFATSPFEVEVVAEDVSDDESAGSFDNMAELDEDADGTDRRQIIHAADDGGEEV
jgi:hypothetical protein